MPDDIHESSMVWLVFPVYPWYSFWRKVSGVKGRKRELRLAVHSSPSAMIHVYS